MSKTIFHAVPAMRCHCPAKHFRSVQQAIEYARKAADAFRVSYASGAFARARCGSWIWTTRNRANLLLNFSLNFFL